MSTYNEVSLAAKRVTLRGETVKLKVMSKRSDSAEGNTVAVRQASQGTGCVVEEVGEAEQDKR